MITRRIEAAQKAVESQNFEARKHLLEYDDVMNKQREAVYGLRRQLLEGVDQKDLILEDYVSPTSWLGCSTELRGEGSSSGRLEHQGHEGCDLHAIRRGHRGGRTETGDTEPAGTWGCGL